MLVLTYNADKYGYFGPFDKNHAQPKTRQNGKVFSMMHVVSHIFCINVFFIHLRTRKMPFNALVFTLRFKVELHWTRAIRHVIAQSVQFSKIDKKLNIDLCQFFSHRKEALSLLKS